MPSLETLKENMAKMKIEPEIMARMNFDPSAGGTYNASVRALLSKMEELLTREQRLALMEQEGCCMGGEHDKKDIAFAEKYADRPLAEKIKLHNAAFDVSPILNDDGTITGALYGYQNGVHAGRTTCSCPHIIREVKDPATVPITYCGCCAANIRYHFQKALGIELRLKEIVSSPLNTNGEKRCEFLYDVIE